MAINIKIDGLSTDGNSRAFCGLRGDDINVELKDVHTDENSKIFQNVTDTKANEIVATLLDMQDRFDNTTSEYHILQCMRTNMEQSDKSIKEILKRYLPNLVTSTLANVLGNLIV